VLDDVERRSFLVEPAREDALPAALRVAHVELHEGAGQRLHFPGGGRLAGSEPDDRVARPHRLTRLERYLPRNSIALVEQPDHRDPLGHRSGAGGDGGHGLRNVHGPRLADRLAVALGLRVGPAVASGKRGREDEYGAELTPHAWSGVQAS
jgi:hypothetical protein